MLCGFTVTIKRVYKRLSLRYNICYSLSNPAGLAACQALECWRLVVGHVLVVVELGCEQHILAVYEAHVADWGEVPSHGLYLLSESPLSEAAGSLLVCQGLLPPDGYYFTVFGKTRMPTKRSEFRQDFYAKIVKEAGAAPQGDDAGLLP